MFFYIVLVDNSKLSGPAGQAQHMEQTKKTTYFVYERLSNSE